MKTIALDFDGVIHKYSKGWQDGSIYDEPIEGAEQFILELMREGYAVFIFTARSPKQILNWINKDYGLVNFSDRTPMSEYSAEVISRFAKFWNKPNVLGITNKKLPAIAYIDDRAIKFDGDWKLVKSQLTSLTA